MKKYGFGVDVGGTTCKIGLFDMSGVILEKWEIKTNTENNGASILDAATSSNKRILIKKMFRELDLACLDRLTMKV